MNQFSVLRTAAVVIPVYKPDMSPDEEISFRQCVEVLKSHPIVLIKPHSLSIDTYLDIYPRLLVESFDDAYFQSIRGYNRLMLSADLYERFTAYEYILIHQLDAFVFRDELLHWCKKNYDYIGAPWLKPPGKENVFERIARARQSRKAYRENTKQPGSILPVEWQINNRVGNGGFSLRRVSKMLLICRQRRSMIEHYNRHNTHHLFNEDVFWALEPNRFGKVLAIPDYKKAARFSIEFHAVYAFELNKGKLPFGCHAWHLHRDFWEKIFQEAGHNIQHPIAASK